jgi:hypothetical protein
MAEEEVVTQTEETESSKPDFVQDKFWNKDTNEINIEELAIKSNVPEKYEISMPEIPENIQMDIDPEMPLLQWWTETARSKGLSQEEFNKGIEAFVNNEVSALPDIENEKELLGENANQRIEAADLWSKKNLSTDSYEAIAEFASTAKGVKALEEIMKLNKDAPIPQTETAIEAAPSLEDLRSMMKDPRYWRDGERDQAYINKVSNMYEKYYGSKKAS